MLSLRRLATIYLRRSASLLTRGLDTSTFRTVRLHYHLITLSRLMLLLQHHQHVTPFLERLPPALPSGTIVRMIPVCVVGRANLIVVVKKEPTLIAAVWV